MINIRYKCKRKIQALNQTTFVIIICTSQKLLFCIIGDNKVKKKPVKFLFLDDREIK